MDINQLKNTRPIMRNDSNALIRKLLEDCHKNQENPEITKKMALYGRKVKLLSNTSVSENRAVKVFLTKPTKFSALINSSKHDGTENIEPLNSDAMPKWPKIHKKCRFISSLNSSHNDLEAKITPSVRLSRSPSIRPAVFGSDSPFAFKRKLSIQSFNKNTFTLSQPSDLTRDQSSMSRDMKERKSRLEIELKRPYIKPITRSRLPESNEYLHNEYIRFKCSEKVVKVSKKYMVINK